MTKTLKIGDKKIKDDTRIPKAKLNIKTKTHLENKFIAVFWTIV